MMIIVVPIHLIGYVEECISALSLYIYFPERSYAGRPSF